MELKLLCFFLVAFFELVDTAGSVYQHGLTGEERVGCVGDFQLDHRVLVAIFPFHGFF